MNKFFYILIYLVLALVKSMRCSGRKKLIAENMAFRRQLMSLTRNSKRSPKLLFCKGLSFGLLANFISPRRLQKIAIAIKPSKILNFHRALVKRKYKNLFANKNPRASGQKRPSQELIDIIIEIKKRNPRFRYLRITMQINKAFGLNLIFGVIRRVLNKHFKSPYPEYPGPSCLTFLGHIKDSLWQLVFFKVESISLKSHDVMVILEECTRRIIDFAIHYNYMDGVKICKMFNKIIAGKSLLKYIPSDNDLLFRFHRWQVTLRVLEIYEIKTVPYTPVSHPFVERVIGTVRREYLDNILFFNKNDLEKKLESFRNFL